MTTPNLISADGQPASATERNAWTIVGLLFLVQVVNYADKSVVGLAAPHIMREFGLDAEQYGLVASSFYMLYALGGLGVAFLAAPYVRPRRILAVLLLLWSVSQLPVVFAATLPVLIGCRTLLGASEGGGTPTSFNVCHEWFASDQRSFPSALLMFGSTAGLLLAAPGLSYVITLLGWRAAFLACSLLGGAALLLWLLLASDGPHAAPLRSWRAGVASAPERLQGGARWPIWTDGTMVGNLVVGFCAYWVVGVLVSWLAPFVARELALGTVVAGWTLSVVYLAHAAILLGISFGSQRMLRRGASSRAARGLVMAACLLGSAAAFVGAAVLTAPFARLVFMGLALGLPAVIFPLGAAMIGEVAPPDERNRLVTTIFAAETTSAILSPLITGHLLAADPVYGWQHALLVHAGVCLLGAVAAVALLRPERSIARLRTLGLR